MIFATTRSARGLGVTAIFVWCSTLLQQQSHFFASAQQQEDAANCIDISSFAEKPEDLATFIKGGNQTNLEVFFDIPRMETPYTLCLEDVLIPDTVGDTECVNVDDCYIVIGRRTIKDSETNTCASSDRGIASCYGCSCDGFSFGFGSTNQTLVSGCGNSRPGWATSCPDFTNGRGASDVMTVQINACPPRSTYCNECALGATQAPLRVSVGCRPPELALLVC